MPPTKEELIESNAREIIKRISDAAIELAFVRHDLTTTEFEDADYADAEESTEAFTKLVEGVKTDVLACLTGDETGCLDPEDVDYDNELRWLERRLNKMRQAGIETIYRSHTSEDAR